MWRGPTPLRYFELCMLARSIPCAEGDVLHRSCIFPHEAWHLPRLRRVHWLPGRAQAHTADETARVAEAWRRSVEVLVVEEGIASKSVALGLEALRAARAICSRPHTCRGGPWSSPTALSDAALRDVAAVARCHTLMSIWDIARQRKGGALWKHLEDLAFTAASDAPSSAVVVRGAWVRRIKRSGRSGASGPSGQSGRSGASGPSGRGAPGNKYRRKLVLEGKLKRTDLKHKQLHRGREPTLRRQAETLNRGGRR